MLLPVISALGITPPGKCLGGIPTPQTLTGGLWPCWGLLVDTFQDEGIRLLICSVDVVAHAWSALQGASQQLQIVKPPALDSEYITTQDLAQGFPGVVIS